MRDGRAFGATLTALVVAGSLCSACGGPRPRPAPVTEAPAEAGAPAPEDAAVGSEVLAEDLEPGECELVALTRRVRGAVRRGQLERAEQVVLGWVAASPPMPGTGSELGARRMLGHVRWLRGLDRSMEALGVRWLDRPGRLFVREDTVARRAPGSEELHDGWGSLAGGEPVDVWAEGPGGAVLVALPEHAPGFRVGEDPYALAGWLERQEVSPAPPPDRVLDVGRPLEIWRGPPIESLDPAADGQPCTRCGEPGLGFDLYGDQVLCFPLEELCGAPGLTPPVYDPAEPILGGCADCPAHYRSFRSEGGYCRAEEPGWTWRCAPGGGHLVCTAPGASPAAVSPPPAGAAPTGPGERSGRSPAAEELAALAAAAAAGELRSDDPALLFHAVASPAEVFRLGCSATGEAAREALFGAIRSSGYLERLPDAALLPCVERAAMESDQLQMEVAAMPDPRLRRTLELIVASPRIPSFADAARGSLAILEATSPDELAATVRRLATEDRTFFNVLRSALIHTADPRPLVPALLDVLEGRQGGSEYARGRAGSALADMTARSFRSPAEARRFWEENRDRTVDEWLASATEDRSTEVRMRAYERLGRRAPSEAGRRRLAHGLEEEDLEARYAAAVALARWGDRRAAPVLAAFLPRLGAFLALGRLHDSTLGFDWHAPTSEQRAAVARWREWARGLGAAER